MKKIYLWLVLTLGTASLFSQTLFTYGDKPVGKEEFLRAYNKNKIPVTDKEKSLREYLDLYLKFKLKVKAAQELHLDTLQQLKYDMQSFSSQVEESYMNDEKRINTLLEEVIERSQKDIHLVHFFAPLAANTSATDSAKAIKAMDEIVEILKTDVTNYDAIAAKISEKYIPVTAKDIGYITALSLPYAIENLVYNLTPGGSSTVYRTKAGLHIFKKIEQNEIIYFFKRSLKTFSNFSNFGAITALQYPAFLLFA